LPPAPQPRSCERGPRTTTCRRKEWVRSPPQAWEADLKLHGIAAGRETLYQLFDHLGDAFLLQAVSVAADSEKRRQVNPRKVYPVDHGMTPVFDRSQKANRGQALEVAVFNELLRRGAEAAYVKTKSGFEVDFYV